MGLLRGAGDGCVVWWWWFGGEGRGGEAFAVWATYIHTLSLTHTHTDTTHAPLPDVVCCSEGVGFLRDELSLAHYNITSDIVLVLGTKERGGRKKG